MFTPESRVRLASVPFDKSDGHAILFSTAAAQLDYFISRQVKIVEGCTYVRKDKVIRVPYSYDELANVNYVFYQNANFTNRYFYAYVTSLEYVSDAMTALHCETDVMQTWMFDVTFQPSFVVREHVTTDTPGLHTVDESLEFGEYVYNGNAQSAGISEICMIVGSTIELSSPFDKVSGNTGTGIYQGIAFFYFANNSAGSSALNAILAAIETAGKSSGIVFIGTAPRVLVNPSGLGISNGGRIGAMNLMNYYDQVDYQASVNKPTTIAWNSDSYTPKNKKLLTYPYALLMASNQAGATKNYRWEWFNSEDAIFRLESTLDASPIVLSSPINYRGTAGDHTDQIYAVDDGIAMKGYPQCSWNSDVYKNWLAQNSVSLGVNFAGSALAIIGGVATGNGMAAASGLLGVVGQMGQIAQHEVIPAESKGSVSNGTANAALGYQDIVYYKVNIRPEIARKLDGFFELFGYKVNELKVPNRTGRPYWNYVKCIDPNITGDIPNEDMVEMKKIYSDGVTLWHTTSGFLNYALSNH